MSFFKQFNFKHTYIALCSSPLFFILKGVFSLQPPTFMQEAAVEKNHFKIKKSSEEHKSM